MNPINTTPSTEPSSAWGVPEFAGWILILFSFVSGVLLINLWRTFFPNGRNEISTNGNGDRKDYGLLYMGAAILVWSLSGLTTKYFKDNGHAHFVLPIRLFLSSMNSFLLLAGVSHFEHAPGFITANRRRSRVVAGVACALTAGLTYLFYSAYPNSKSLQALPDFLLSVPITGLLVVALFKTFWQRSLQSVAVFSCVSLLLVLLDQPFIKTALGIEFLTPVQVLGHLARLSFILTLCFLAYSMVANRYDTAAAQVEGLTGELDDLQKQAVIERQNVSRDERELAWRDVALKAAHKIGNPIDAIDTYCQQATKKAKSINSNSLVTILEDMDISIESAKNVLNEFKSLTKLSQLNRSEHDVVLIMKRARQPHTDSDVEFTIEVADKLLVPVSTPTVSGSTIVIKSFAKRDQPVLAWVDSEKLQHCFAELISNSLHFLTTAPKRIAVRFELADGHIPEVLNPDLKYVRIIYEDNGPGIAHAHKRAIFDPFWTQYEHGTGLGLAIVHRAIELHDGWIEERGTPGSGARFVIHLPITPPQNLTSHAHDTAR